MNAIPTLVGLSGRRDEGRRPRESGQIENVNERRRKQLGKFWSSAQGDKGRERQREMEVEVAMNYPFFKAFLRPSDNIKARSRVTGMVSDDRHHRQR